MSGLMAGRVALITGGGTGIGAAAARRFVADGGQVAVMGRRREPLQAVAVDTGGLAIQADVGDPDACQRAVAETVARFGRLDVLVANAGIEQFGSATEISLEDWRAVQRINVDGVLFSARAAIQQMRVNGGGTIVVVASVAALVGAPHYVGYVTTKAALLGMTRSLAFDYGTEGIRVNAILPGWVRTEMTERSLQHAAREKGISFEEMIRRVTANYPLRRMADPDEIAAGIEFLASAQSSFITGAILLADGGGSVVDVGTLEFQSSQP
jgi:meso-butanediol dehydrogenase / (S,S)-butanediol dehydrogenase / diacetyl reductase